jgi:hypothetical protein
MNLNISTVANGVKITIEDEEYVIQEIEDNEIEAWRSALAAIYEQFGPPQSRHDKKRLYFTIAPGDKNDDFVDTIYQ